MYWDLLKIDLFRGKVFMYEYEGFENDSLINRKPVERV